MFNGQNPTRHYAFALAWLLLGTVIGLHFPDLDTRFQWLIPSWALLHRSILTHGLIISSLLFWLTRKYIANKPSFRLFVMGLSLAFAVHLCFDFFPRGWVGFALIHIPLYGRATAFSSQAWIILSIVTCLYLAFLMVQNIVEFALSVGCLAMSFCISAFENRGAILLALTLLALSTITVIVTMRRVHGNERRQP